MNDEFLSTSKAATRLGVSVARLYEWLSLSDREEFLLRGEQVTIDYLQGGAKGQGRIRVATREVERLLQLMRVVPQATKLQRTTVRKPSLKHISAPLGRPDDD